MRRSLMLVGGLALAVTMWAPAGAGQVERVRTNVVLKDSCSNDGGAVSCRQVPRRRNYTARFHGRVRSEVDRCERNRTIKLIRTYTTPPGRRGDPTVEATTKTDENGRWEVILDKPPWGIYLAKATRKRKGEVICRAGRSEKDEHQPVLAP